MNENLYGGREIEMIGLLGEAAHSQLEAFLGRPDGLLRLAAERSRGPYQDLADPGWIPFIHGVGVQDIVKTYLGEISRFVPKGSLRPLLLEDIEIGVRPYEEQGDNIFLDLRGLRLFVVPRDQRQPDTHELDYNQWYWHARSIMNRVTNRMEQFITDRIDDS